MNSPEPVMEHRQGEGSTLEGITPASPIHARKEVMLEVEKQKESSANLDASAEILVTHVYEYSEAEARAVRWKIDLHLMPILWFTGMMSAVDKIIISNAALYGLKSDLHLTTLQYSWVGSIVSFGVLVMEWPGALMVQKFPLGRFIPAIVALWGVITMCTAASNNFSTLMALRFILGLAEGPIFPGLQVIVVMFYKREEQPLRIAIYLASLATLFIGPLSYGIGKSGGSTVATWRLLYIMMGGITFLWGLAMFFLLPNSPLTYQIFSEKEKYIAIDRIKQNLTGIENKRFKWPQMWEAFVDPKSLVLFGSQVLICSYLGGLTSFAALIVNSFGYTPLQTVLLGMPTGVLQTVSSIILAYAGVQIKNTRCLIIATSLLIPVISTALVWKLPTSNHSGRLACYYVTYLFWGAYTLSASLPAINTSGHSKKVTTYAMSFAAYTTGLFSLENELTAGNIIGPFYFHNSYTQGYAALMGSAAVASVLILLYGVICIIQNRSKDRAVTAGNFDNQQRALDDHLMDITDKQKKDFRYEF